jgi:hypothetical protein
MPRGLAWVAIVSMPHGICFVKMVFDWAKNHLTIIATNQND